MWDKVVRLEQIRGGVVAVEPSPAAGACEY